MGEFRQLPLSLQCMFGAFLATPLLSLTFLDAPWALMVEQAAWYAALVGATYWLVPWLLALLILNRHAILVPVFAVECALLLAEGTVFGRVQLVELVYARYALVLLLAGMFILLVNRDILLPFLRADLRGWRKAPRVELNRLVQLRHGASGAASEMIVEDASVTGLAVYGDEKTAVKPGRGEVVSVAFRQLEVACDVLWTARFPPVVKLGLRARDPAAMARFFEGLGYGLRSGTWALRVRRLWAARGTRRALVGGFAAAFALVMTMPALSRWVQPARLETRTGGPAFDSGAHVVGPMAEAGAALPKAADCAAQASPERHAAALFSPGESFEGALGLEERWYLASDGCWVYVTPDEKLYVWDGAQGGKLVKDFAGEGGVYGAPERLYGERKGTLAAMKARLAIARPASPDFYHDWAGGDGGAATPMKEKWLRAAGTGWIYLVKSEDSTEVYRWQGGPADNAQLIGRLCGARVYDDPMLLAEPKAEGGMDGC